MVEQTIGRPHVRNRTRWKQTTQQERGKSELESICQKVTETITELLKRTRAQLAIANSLMWEYVHTVILNVRQILVGDAWIRLHTAWVIGVCLFSELCFFRNKLRKFGRRFTYAHTKQQTKSLSLTKPQKRKGSSSFPARMTKTKARKKFFSIIKRWTIIFW